MPIVSTAARAIAARLVLCVAVVASVLPAAWAQGPHGGRGGPQRGAWAEARGARQAERAQQRAGRNGPREMPQRPVEAPPPQQVAPPVAPEPAQPGRPGRLSPDERRALRQQINEAGRDVYRPNRP